MKRFAFGLLAGCIGVFGTIAASYGLLALASPENMPAPPITRLSALDEKLRYIRRNPELDPQILAIGSSIAWRQLDGAAFDAMAGRSGAFLNGGTVHLQMHQSREMLDFYLDHFSKVRSVLLLAGPPDFSDCSTAPAAMMPEDEAAAYAFRDWPAAYFYLRFFAPQRFIKAAANLPERQKPLLGDLWLDRWGSGPLHVPETMQRGLRYGPTGTDPACIDALLGMAGDLRARGVAFTLVFPPVHPAYREKYPAVMASLCGIARRLEPAIADGSLRLLQYQDDPRYGEADFFDAFHLQFPAVQRFSGEVAQAMGGPPPAEMLIASSRRGVPDTGKALRPAVPAAAPPASQCGLT
ncbi:MAG TPA: hypothetical protein VKZ87_09955 [Ferrovibrio sp.]|jgi:hypothetical protein|uniref:hypothetical protein n=1 Tax=Ferrovibrio sp. TaxID=1917215 RepID=UPI002B4B4917|nr:hypothetical protein [Ferrovibrio sp.]HLT77699.1 hypothetical protein [Ferrovibrio sp.]